MKNEVYCSVVLPAYAESENLKLLLPKLNSVLEDLHITYEIIVIDAHVTRDDTEKVCNMNNVTYINRAPGNDYGDAVRTAISHVKGKWLVALDADGSHAPSFIEKMLAKLKSESNLAMVIASRYIDGGGSDNGKVLVFMSKLLNMLYSLLLNIKCKDVSNSFRLYNTEMLKNLKLKSQHFDILEEILVKLRYYNPTAKIIELPFHFEKRISGESKRSLLLFLWHYMITLCKLSFWKLGKVLSLK